MWKEWIGCSVLALCTSINLLLEVQHDTSSTENMFYLSPHSTINKGKKDIFQLPIKGLLRELELIDDPAGFIQFFQLWETQVIRERFLTW